MIYQYSAILEEVLAAVTLSRTLSVGRVLGYFYVTEYMGNCGTYKKIHYEKERVTEFLWLGHVTANQQLLSRIIVIML